MAVKTSINYSLLKMSILMPVVSFRGNTVSLELFSGIIKFVLLEIVILQPTLILNIRWNINSQNATLVLSAGGHKEVGKCLPVEGEVHRQLFLPSEVQGQGEQLFRRPGIYVEAHSQLLNKNPAHSWHLCVSQCLNTGIFMQPGSQFFFNVVTLE